MDKLLGKGDKGKAPMQWPRAAAPGVAEAMPDTPTASSQPSSPLIGAGAARNAAARAGLEGRKSSFIQARRVSRGEAALERDAAGVEKAPPTNEELAQAVQEKIADAVETQRKYKHVLWYSLFVAAYLVVLYLQASAYDSGQVVATLRQALMPDGGMVTTFQSQDDVLAYIGSKIIAPTWVDPTCGDGVCEFPWEFPSYGRFGCRADCGRETNTTHILVQVVTNFVGHPTISPTVLMAAASWNLCLSDPARRKRGEQDLCWYDADQTFSEITGNRLETMDVVDGSWYISLKGDYAGRVSGYVYDLNNASNPIPLTTTPAWEQCKLPTVDTRAAGVAATGAVRRMMAEWSAGHRRRKLLEVAGEPAQHTVYADGVEQPQQAEVAEFSEQEAALLAALDNIWQIDDELRARLERAGGAGGGAPGGDAARGAALDGDGSPAASSGAGERSASASLSREMHVEMHVGDGSGSEGSRSGAGGAALLRDRERAEMGWEEYLQVLREAQDALQLEGQPDGEGAAASLGTA